MNVPQPVLAYSADISYWVGKQSLRGWKRLVMEKLDVNVANGETENTHNDGDGSTTTGTDMKETVKEVVSEDTSNDGSKYDGSGEGEGERGGWEDGGQYERSSVRGYI